MEEIKDLLVCPEDWEWILLMTWGPLGYLRRQTSPI